MKIGITYDTPTTYGLESDNQFICDLCDEGCIANMMHTLVANGHEVTLLEGAASLFDINASDYDVIFNTSEGIVSRNREVFAPALLEAHGCHYIGADAYIAAITLDKELTSQIAIDLGIFCPKTAIVDRNDSSQTIGELLKTLRFPIVVKPNLGGNSSGVFVCSNPEAAILNVGKIFHALPDRKALLQEFIFGTEVTVPIFGNGDDIQIFDIIGLKEQRDGSFWINNREKVFGGVTEVAASLTQPIEKKIKNACRKLYRRLGFRDYSRFDFRINDDGIFFLEANAFPYIGEDGAMYESFAPTGGSYYRFLMYLIEIARKRTLFEK